MAEALRDSSGDDFLGEVRARREGVRSAMVGLESAVSAPAPGRDDEWRAGVARALTRLRTAFQGHVEVTEADDGVFAQVVEAAPRLANQVKRLHAEHVEIGAALAAVDECLAGDAEPVRDAALDLLGLIARHRHRGADLLHEAFCVDISVGD
jgi:hypothetical protein